MRNEKKILESRPKRPMTLNKCKKNKVRTINPIEIIETVTEEEIFPRPQEKTKKDDQQVKNSIIITLSTLFYSVVKMALCIMALSMLIRKDEQT